MSGLIIQEINIMQMIVLIVPICPAVLSPINYFGLILRVDSFKELPDHDQHHKQIHTHKYIAVGAEHSCFGEIIPHYYCSLVDETKYYEWPIVVPIVPQTNRLSQSILVAQVSQAVGNEKTAQYTRQNI
jgi:hypothetical protein